MLAIKTIVSGCGRVIVFQRPLGLFLISEASWPFFCLDYSLLNSVALNITSTAHLLVDSCVGVNSL